MTGRVEADCTSATSTGEVVSDVISQAVATSFIHMQILAVIQIIHSMRKVGVASGVQTPGAAAGGAPPSCMAEGSSSSLPAGTWPDSEIIGFWGARAAESSWAMGHDSVAGKLC
ncbi:hypothetical protein SDC9_149554 [bioreactor metagenome]|uniref:Uncharacterized protein n=1 Tax=bioreactor metagenome TaxID=1076179 RepID=A0A645EK00_9ZZZZ